MFADTLVQGKSAPVAGGELSAICAADLARIRSGILIFSQDRTYRGDLESAIRDLKLFISGARSGGSDYIAERSAECQRVLEGVLDLESDAHEKHLRRALDLIAEMEASMLRAPLRNDDPFSISGFLDASFDRLTHGSDDETIHEEPEVDVGFEIDEETLEIFRAEAAELLENISLNLTALNDQPGDLDALWNIRRCAHTFKGAAGIVGMNEVSALAHRVEDLLDQLAKDEFEADAAIICLLTASTEHLRSMTFGCGTADESIIPAALYSEFDRILADNAGAIAVNVDSSHSRQTNTADVGHITVQTEKPAPAPIVRVALDRLDELLNLTRNLVLNRSALAKELSVLSAENTPMVLERVSHLFEAQRQLTDELQDKLLCIRMVKFGTLTTRLNRAVHVTCQEEDKKAELVISGEDFEIDTQILDSLVEPLLHLLRNAVVHGIEPPERRRLIGKPEKGQIRIEVGSVGDEIVLSVRDDGRGISISKLREKAVASGVIDGASADDMTEDEAFDLIFMRGITTADNLSINAGRGVGMSIVKESIGSIGGTISIAAEPQRGTTFTIKIPLVLAAAAFDMVEEDDHFLGDISTRQSADLTVLIVDDSSSMRQLITRMIEKSGCKCIPATDGMNAVEILSDPKNLPDIILTDLEMPNVNGYEFLEALKNDERLHDIPVVMITSRAGSEHKQKALDLGANDYIVKPFTAQDIERILDRFCRSRAS